MHVAFHFVLQPADVNSQRRGLSVLNAIRTFCDVCVPDVLGEPARASQPQSLVRVFLKSHSLGGKSADGYLSSVKKKRAHHHRQHFQRTVLARLFRASPQSVGEERFGDCAQPDDDRYGSWIRVA